MPPQVEARKQNDPSAAPRALLGLNGVPEARLAVIEQEARQEIESALAAALAAPWPDVALAFTDVQSVGGPTWRS